MMAIEKRVDYIPVCLDGSGWVRADGADSGLMECPVCGELYVHPVSIECRSPGTATGNVRIDGVGLHVTPHGKPAGRGVRIRMAFSCEQGCRFEYEWHFHKGQTYVSRDLDDTHVPTDPGGGVIWRD